MKRCEGILLTRPLLPVGNQISNPGDLRQQCVQSSSLAIFSQCVKLDPRQRPLPRDVLRVARGWWAQRYKGQNDHALMDPSLPPSHNPVSASKKQDDLLLTNKAGKTVQTMRTEGQAPASRTGSAAPVSKASSTIQQSRQGGTMPLRANGLLFTKGTKK